MLASDVISIVRTVIDHDVDTQVTDAQLLTLLSPRYLRLYRTFAQLVPTLYTVVAPQFTIAAGTNTQDVTAAPLSLTDFDRVRRIRFQSSPGLSGLVGITVANPIDPENLPYGQMYAFLERGTVLEFYPSGSVAGLSIELSYLSKGTAVTSTGQTLTGIPDGGDLVLAHQVAADCRVRFDDDPSYHLQVAAAELADLKWYVRRRYGVHPEGPSQETDW